MSKKQIMKQAHKLAKKLVEKVGNYMIALKLALKKIWAMAKAGRKRMSDSAFKGAVCQLPQSKDMGLVTYDLTVSGNNATSLLPHYTWLHHWVVGSTHLTNTFTH